MEQFTFKPTSSRRFRFKRIIFFLLLNLILSSCITSINHIEKETFYIPKCVEGKIYILFNCKNGKPKKWINGRRLYEIPSSGVLKTQFKENTGHLIIGESENEKLKKFREYAKFFFVDEYYKPIKEINYSPYNSINYKKFFKVDSFNIIGTNGVVVMGNGKEKFVSSDYYLFYGDSLKPEKGTFIEKRLRDWRRFEKWNE